MRLLSYTNLDWANSAVDRKSTSSYCFSMGSAMISSSDKKKSFVVLSTAKAEYIATRDASKEAIWLCKFLAGLFGDVLEMTIIHCDNQRCVKLSKNPVYHDRTKHIEIRYHYLRYMVQKGDFRDKLGLAENASLVEKDC